MSDETGRDLSGAQAPGNDDGNGHAPPQEVVEAGPARRALAWAEDLLYFLTAGLLIVGALGVLINGGVLFVRDLAEPYTASLELLDSLLLIFIFAELLYAVRITIARHELSAEPFLIVGILAAIKETVVLSLEASRSVGSGDEFIGRIIEIGVLSGVILALSTAIVVLRRSTRE